MGMAADKDAISFFVTTATSFNVVSIESFSSNESNEHITSVAQIHSF